MFVFLSKLLPVLFFPISLASGLLLVSIFIKNTKIRRRLVIAAFLLLWILSNPWVSTMIVKSLEWQYLPPDHYVEADAIVLLGGGTEPIEYPRQSVGINFAGDRVLHAARLYREGLAPIIVVTAGNLPWTDTQQSPAEDMRDLLIFLGVDKAAIILEEKSLNTYENALYTREILQDTGIEKILLVTSALHMPRSVPLFEKQGFTVTPAPTDYHVTVSPGQKPISETWPDYLFGLFPNADSLNKSTLAVKEYIGIAVYTLRGWN